MMRVQGAEPALRFGASDVAEVVSQFHVYVEGLRVEVPQGFKTDGSSIPRPFTGLISRRFRYVVPSTVHDWLYTSHEVSREEADVAFYLLLCHYGATSIKALLMFTAVRAFGWIRWPKCKKQSWKMKEVQYGLFGTETPSET